MKDKKYYTTDELAKMLGVSRITVFKRIKRGEIKAEKIGRNFAIPKNEIDIILGKELNSAQKKEIEKAVAKTVADYGETLRLLGDA